MNIKQAENKIFKNEKEIIELKHYIELTETYIPETFVEHVVLEYARSGSLLQVVDWANASGHTLNGKMYTQADVSRIIREKPKDELHKIVQRFLKKKDISSKKYYKC